MNALEICHRLNDKIIKGKIHTGEVHSVFNNALNIITEEDELVTLLFHHHLMAPMCILIKEHRHFKGIGITKGMKVTLNKERVFSHSLKLSINLTQAKIFYSQPNYYFLKTTESQLLNRLSMVEHTIYNRGNFEGIAPLVFRLGEVFYELEPFIERTVPINKYESFIKERFIHFIGLVLKNDRTNIPKATRKIIGFGPGLTPSTDDFIAGLMTSLLYMTQYFKLDYMKIKKLNAAMIQEIRGKTTKVSEGMLIFSAVGEVMQAIRECMTLLLSDASADMLIKKIETVLEFGNTSGTDILCGVYIGARMMVNRNFRRLFSNEDIS